jgi:hypothetical protein
VNLSLAVDITQNATGLGVRNLRLGIHPYPAHQRHVDGEPAVAQREPRDIVTSAPDGEWYPPLAHKIYACHDVGNTESARNDRRTTIDHSIPDRTGVIVFGVVGENERTP